MTQPDGLGDLAARRARATQRTPRVAPPPRHPRVAASAPTPDPQAPAEQPATETSRETDEEPATPALHVAVDTEPPAIEPPAEQSPRAPAARRTSPRPAASGRRVGEEAPAASAKSENPLRLGQFYVDGASDRWLNELRAKALLDRGDRSLSASAVVRLALRTLREQMTQDQVLDALGPNETTGESRRGRPRR